MKKEFIKAFFLLLILFHARAFGQTGSDMGAERLFYLGAARFSKSQIKDPAWEEAKEYLKAAIRVSPEHQKSSALLQIMEQMEKQDQQQQENQSDQQQQGTESDTQGVENQQEAQSDTSFAAQSQSPIDSIGDSSQISQESGADTSMTKSQKEAARLLELFIENQEKVSKNIRDRSIQRSRSEKDW